MTPFGLDVIVPRAFGQQNLTQIDQQVKQKYFVHSLQMLLNRRIVAGYGQSNGLAYVPSGVARSPTGMFGAWPEADTGLTLPFRALADIRSACHLALAQIGRLPAMHRRHPLQRRADAIRPKKNAREINA